MPQNIQSRSFTKLALLGLMVALLWPVGSAGAYEEIRIYGVLTDKDLLKKTVTVSDVVYEVGASTRMMDKEGQVITLEALQPLNPTTRAIHRDSESTLVELRAANIRGRWILSTLQLIERLPQ